KGTPGATFSGVILSVESDSSGPGVVDSAAAVSGTFESNGLLVVTIPDLENPSFTVALVSAFTGTVGATDIDTNDDGVADDISTVGTVYDAIGIPDVGNDEQFLYGADFGGLDFTYTGDEPRLVFRDGITDAWYAVNDVTGDLTDEIYSLNATLTGNADFDVNPADGSTFGMINPSNTTASINENKLNSVIIYPNPTSVGFVNIKSTSNNIISVVIFDVLGKRVLSQIVNNGRLNVSALRSGIYIMKISQNNRTVTKKLVIK
ncbi:MAG: T9SS type A sorting domain-containing protein, partial [Aquaticitalea sp.]